MLPRNSSELEEIHRECQRMVLKRAAMSGMANLVPVLGLDIADDGGLFMQLLPSINNRFGLSSDQIDRLDPQTRAFVYGFITYTGAELAGKIITKQLILAILKRIGIRVEAKQVTTQANFVKRSGEI